MKNKSNQTPREYKYITRLIERITRTNQPLNDSFRYYNYLVTLQSNTSEICAVIVSAINNRAGEKELMFNIDYNTKRLHIYSTPCHLLATAVIDAYAALFADIEISFKDNYLHKFIHS